MAMDLSYVASILDQRSDLTVVSRDVSIEVQRLKDNLREVIEEKRINLRPLVAENERLARRAHVLGEKAKEVSEILTIKLKDELESCSCEMSTLSDSLQEHKLALNTLDRIIAVHACLEATHESMRNKCFYECSASLQNAQDVVKSSPDLKEARIFTHLCREVVILRERLLFEMSEIWADCVHFDVDNNNKQTEVVLSIKTSLSTEIKQIIPTLFRISDSAIIQRFFKKLKDRILVPIILHESVVSVKETKEAAVLSLSINEQNGSPYYLQVFDKLIRVIEFVRTHLNVNIPENNGDFIEAMGHSMAQEITTSLIKNSLSEAIPSQADQLESFGDIVANAEKFQASLQQLGFLPHNYGSFIDDASGTSVFFANKIYLSYLDRARTIMKKDLHTMRKSKEVVAPDWDVMPPPVRKALKDHFNISNRPVLMESHQISTSAQDVLDLVDAIVKELKKSEESRGLRLLYTVRNIFEMYSAVVPLQHRKLLETIPQQVALFHNNCLHFAYRLLVLGCECRGTWHPRLREHYHVFLDEASSLRQLAVSSLESCVSNQRSQIIANLCDSGLAKLREGPNLDPGTERSVRQCIRQLQLVRNVWVDILPEAVYANTMGFLIDEFTQAVVTYVTDAEDISAQAASELVKIFGIVDDRLPKLFNEPKEIHRLCRKWDRFREMMFVLGSNLEKFSDRWASGLGPLAHAFTKREAQGLVRALFRNTERRAVVLSQIYNS